jgi:hypothetical protein
MPTLRPRPHYRGPAQPVDLAAGQPPSGRSVRRPWLSSALTA